MDPVKAVLLSNEGCGGFLHSSCSQRGKEEWHTGADRKARNSRKGDHVYRNPGIYWSTAVFFLQDIPLKAWRFTVPLEKQSGFLIPSLPQLSFPGGFWAVLSFSFCSGKELAATCLDCIHILQLHCPKKVCLPFLTTYWSWKKNQSQEENLFWNHVLPGIPFFELYFLDSHVTSWVRVLC